MSKHTNSDCTTIDEMIQLLEKDCNEIEKIAILGGHFLIDYDPEKKNLKPLIVEDIETDELHKVAKLEAGDFPFCSFKISLSLFDNFTNKNIDTKIILLVNDHKTPYLAAYKKKSELSELRKSYYLKNQIPESFSKLLNEKQLNEKDVLLQNFENKSSINTSNFLFSENYFRKKFDKYLKDKILKIAGFYSKSGSSGKRDIYMEALNSEEDDYCLSIDGACGCSGEVMQFIHSIVLKAKYKELIMFIPYECSIGVNNGINAMMRYFSELDIHIKVKMVTNLPCDNYFEVSSNSKINIIEYSN